MISDSKQLELFITCVKAKHTRVLQCHYVFTTKFLTFSNTILKIVDIRTVVKNTYGLIVVCFMDSKALLGITTEEVRHINEINVLFQYH